MQVKDADSGQFVMDFWETAKKMMTEPAFLDSLKAFDKDNIDPEIIKKLQPSITRDEFEPKKVLKVSKAAFGLASWVKAMDSYHRVAKVVGPKKAALAEAEAKLTVRRLNCALENPSVCWHSLRSSVGWERATARLGARSCPLTAQQHAH